MGIRLCGDLLQGSKAGQRSCCQKYVKALYKEKAQQLKNWVWGEIATTEVDIETNFLIDRLLVSFLAEESKFFSILAFRVHFFSHGFIEMIDQRHFQLFFKWNEFFWDKASNETRWVKAKIKQQFGELTSFLPKAGFQQLCRRDRRNKNSSEGIRTRDGYLWKLSSPSSQHGFKNSLTSSIKWKCNGRWGWGKTNQIKFEEGIKN